MGPTTEVAGASLQGNLITVDVLSRELGDNCPADAAPSGDFGFYVINSHAPELIFKERTEFAPACS